MQLGAKTEIALKGGWAKIEGRGKGVEEDGGNGIEAEVLWFNQDDNKEGRRDYADPAGMESSGIHSLRNPPELLNSADASVGRFGRVARPMG